MKNNKLKVLATTMVLLMFVTAFAVQKTNELKEVTFNTNVTCNACKTAIETGFSEFKGVEKTDVNVEKKTVTLAYDDSKTNLESIKTKLKDLGYTAEDVNTSTTTVKKAASCCAGTKAAVSTTSCAKSCTGK